MSDIGSLVFFYAETPLHAGSGTGLDAVDLPLQRERMSNLPMVQGSGLKGAFRELFTQNYKGADADAKIQALFGPLPKDRRDRAEDDKESEEFAGALALLDARLLLLPVRTVRGGFAWATCPLVLERLVRDLELVGMKRSWDDLAFGEADALVGTKSQITSQDSEVGSKPHLLVEDLDYRAEPNPQVDTLAKWLQDNVIPKTEGYKPFKERLPGQLAVMCDEEFTFLAQHATEVNTRIRMNPETGTVRKGGLWSEESLPTESVLWSVALFSKERRDLTKMKEERQPFGEEALCKSFTDFINDRKRIRLGGDRTVGRGIVGVRVEKRP